MVLINTYAYFKIRDNKLNSVRNMLIFDIGGNVGEWAVAHKDNKRIICVEASPTTYADLLNKIKPYENITPVHAAISNSVESTVKFYDAACSTLSTLNKEWLTAPSSRFHNMAFTEIEVPTMTLDKLIETYGAPSYIKIDVEGAEDIVVKSLSARGDINMIAFEWAAETREVSMKCVDHLHSLGFTKFAVQSEDIPYTYIPTEYPFDQHTLKEYLYKATDKIDWGMIFTV